MINIDPECIDERMFRLFHILWTKAVGSPTYDKKEWLELEKLIWRKQSNQK
jgi:hypothetical protein